MLTLVEIIACRDQLGEAAVLLALVRGAFLVAQSPHGARIANEILGLIADLLRELIRWRWRSNHERGQGRTATCTEL